jgi:radical SAM superfamily enzyme YgiQ (UPF0313 family)
MERVEIKTSQLLLASYLAQFFSVEYADFEVTVGRPNSPTQIKRFERRVREFLESRDFDVLALSCWTSLSYRATMTVARICREIDSRKLIVVGGYHASARPDEFKTEENLVDYVVCGEGELALKELADRFRFVGRPAQTEIIKAPLFAKEHFVGYNWDLVDDFFKKEFPDGIANLYLYLSRGCPFGCSFCMEPLKERKWRAYDPADGVREIRTAAERYRPIGIAAADACFGMKPAWRKEFLRRLADLQPNYWIVFETRPEYLDEEDVDLLKKIKVEVQFGVESCSPDMLRIMKKTRQPEKFLQKFLEISHILSERGVLHRANLIFNHPGETRRTLEETFSFIDSELKNKESSLIWIYHRYMHFPGCELDSNMEYYVNEFGSRFLEAEWWKSADDQYEASMQFIPSRDLDGDNVNLWNKMVQDRVEAFKSSLSRKAFRFAARKYYLDWKDDPRYE